MVFARVRKKQGREANRNGMVSMDEHNNAKACGISQRLYDALRQWHTGTDRGELNALLVELWGPSPHVEKMEADAMAAVRGE